MRSFNPLVIEAGRQAMFHVFVKATKGGCFNPLVIEAGRQAGDASYGCDAYAVCGFNPLVIEAGRQAPPAGASSSQPRSGFNPLVIEAGRQADFM